MRTEHIEYDRTIYRLDELSSEAREKAHAEYLRSGASSDWFYGDGVRDVIKKVEDFFDCRIYGWCVDSYRPEYPSVDFRNEDRLDLKGERARAWFWNNYGNALFPLHRQGNGKDNYWLNCLNTEKAKIASVQIETQKDYFARVRKVYLDPPAKEITEERYEEMLDVLPPCAYTHNGRYSMFYVSEALHFSYHGFYLHDKKTGKYWTKVCDACDRSTWIDVALGLRAA